MISWHGFAVCQLALLRFCCVVRGEEAGGGGGGRVDQLPKCRKAKERIIVD